MITFHEYLQLIKDIERHNVLYFQECRSEISDYDYDLLVKQVEEIEQVHPIGC